MVGEKIWSVSRNQNNCWLIEHVIIVHDMGWYSDVRSLTDVDDVFSVYAERLHRNREDAQRHAVLLALGGT